MSNRKPSRSRGAGGPDSGDRWITYRDLERQLNAQVAKLEHLARVYAEFTQDLERTPRAAKTQSRRLRKKRNRVQENLDRARSKRGKLRSRLNRARPLAEGKNKTSGKPRERLSDLDWDERARRYKERRREAGLCQWRYQFSGGLCNWKVAVRGGFYCSEHEVAVAKWRERQDGP